MFKMTREGDPGWVEPTKAVKLQRLVRHFLRLNPFIGAISIGPEMSIQTFMGAMPGMIQKYREDVIKFLQERVRNE